MPRPAFGKASSRLQAEGPQTAGDQVGAAAVGGEPGDLESLSPRLNRPYNNAIARKDLTASNIYPNLIYRIRGCSA